MSLYHKCCKERKIVLAEFDPLFSNIFFKKSEIYKIEKIKKKLRSKVMINEKKN